MAIRVVDLLEPIQVEERDTQRPSVAQTPSGLPLQALMEVPLVVKLREAVPGQETVHLFVVGRLHIATLQELEHRLAKVNLVVVAQCCPVDTLSIDKGAIGAAEVAKCQIAMPIQGDFGVA